MSSKGYIRREEEKARLNLRWTKFVALPNVLFDLLMTETCLRLGIVPMGNRTLSDILSSEGELPTVAKKLEALDPDEARKSKRKYRKFLRKSIKVDLKKVDETIKDSSMTFGQLVSKLKTTNTATSRSGKEHARRVQMSRINLIDMMCTGIDSPAPRMKARRGTYVTRKIMRKIIEDYGDFLDSYDPMGVQMVAGEVK